MPLSFKEKRQLTKIVNAKIEEIQSGGLGFKEKRAATKALNEAVAKLGAKLDSGKTSSTLEEILAGQHDSLPPMKFLEKLEKAYKETDDLEAVKPPAIKYIEANVKADQILESATEEELEEGSFFESAFSPVAGPNGSESQPDYTAVYMEAMPEGGNRYHINVDRSFEEPQTFRHIIRAIEQAQHEDEVLLKINSPGGRTDSAQAVYVALLETQAHTKAKIINAASSGSIVAMACDEIVPTPFCRMMIHNASAGVAGKVEDMAAAATHYKEFFADWYGQLYAGFMTPEEIQDVVKGQEFWIKEDELKARLENWTPIRERLNSEQQGV